MQVVGDKHSILHNVNQFSYFPVDALHDGGLQAGELFAAMVRV
jgi:hypothetical protein